MKIKILVLLVMVLGYLAVAVVNQSAASRVPSEALINNEVPPDGVNPPHAVDTAGRILPEESTTIPDKPIILGKDSTDPKWGEHKADAPFDHTKHSTDPKYSTDGKTVNACVECHHTEQPSAPPGQPWLKKFVRKEVLTVKQLETSKQPVKSCRACHFQPATEETDEFPPESITYPKASGKPPSGKLTNDVAYHINCNSCHEVARKRDPAVKAPQNCADCHVKKA
jgi:cytochrome c553